MRLTSYTDYALRTLIYLAANRDHLVTIQDIADVHGIAKNHLTKVVHQLGILGIVETVRGRNGGLRLGKPPESINIGEVVRQTETDFYMAECFDSENMGCAYASGCALKRVLRQATNAFLDVLDDVTLAALVVNETGQHGRGTAYRTIPLQFESLAQKS
jgi:Rrf2 family nitric oxide-sensitive transcriptional repressor